MEKYLYRGSYFDIENFNNWEIIKERRGDIMQVLPLMKTKEGFKIGIRYEWCPAYFIREKEVNNYYTIVSGGVDKGEHPRETCHRELREETGLINSKEIGKLYVLKEFLPLTKSTSLRTNLYALVFNEDEAIFEDPQGDNSISEEKSSTLWVSIEEFESLIKNELCDLLTILAFYFMKSTLLELQASKKQL